MSKPRVVLVTGATGSQGGAVARALLARGHRVLAMTRDPRSEAALRLGQAGACLVEADFDDPAALRAAHVHGGSPVDGVYAMSTPFGGGAEAEVRQGTAVVEAAAGAGAGHVVYASIASADRGTGVPHFESKFRVEERLRELGVPWTVLGPVAFLDGFAGGWTRQSVADGQLPFPMDGAKPLQVIALENLGAVAARVFEDPERMRGRRIDVASDELSAARMAEILSEVTGHPVVHHAPDLAALGVDADMAIMMGWLAEAGYCADIPALRAEFPEIGWLTFETWAKTVPWDAPAEMQGV